MRSTLAVAFTSSSSSSSSSLRSLGEGRLQENTTGYRGRRDPPSASYARGSGVTHQHPYSNSSKKKGGGQQGREEYLYGLNSVEAALAACHRSRQAASGDGRAEEEEEKEEEEEEEEAERTSQRRDCDVNTEGLDAHYVAGPEAEGRKLQGLYLQEGGGGGEGQRKAQQHGGKCSDEATRIRAMAAELGIPVTLASRQALTRFDPGGGDDVLML